MLLSLDIKAAFTSMSQTWLGVPLATMEPPAELENLVSSLYAGADTLCMAEERNMHIFQQASGVAQGCPGSGWMFAVGFDALLRTLDATLGEGGVLKACADDAAAECGGIARDGSLALWG